MSSKMNNTGSDNPEDIKEIPPLPTQRRVPARIIILGLIAVVFAIVIGSQVIGVLYAIFFPPAAPVPDQVTLISHTSKDYGVDDWLYASDNISACGVLRYYLAHDGDCRIAPLACDTDLSTAPDKSSTNSQNVARCSGTQNFSIFALRWDVIIATGSTPAHLSEFRLNREIFWTGAVPPNNPPTLNGGFPNFPTDDAEATKSS